MPSAHEGLWKGQDGGCFGYISMYCAPDDDLGQSTNWQTLGKGGITQEDD